MTNKIVKVSSSGRSYKLFDINRVLLGRVNIPVLAKSVSRETMTWQQNLCVSTL